VYDSAARSEVRVRETLVAVKGAGDLASGVIHRLVRAGFAVMATELAQPTVVRRTVAFAEAVALGTITVEGVTARLVTSQEEVYAAIARGEAPVVVDADGTMLKQIRPTVLVEATLSKYNSGVTMDDAPIVIALGPGFEAGKDVHAVIETNRGHNLGRVYLNGSAEPDTGVPGAIGGYTIERLLRAPCAGKLYAVRQIGDLVQANETVAIVDTGNPFVHSRGDPGGRPRTLWSHSSPAPVTAAITGILRGLVRDGLDVTQGMKVGDIDPRAAREHCFTISDKSRAIAGGVLEAILYFTT
jgi:xanthine dehydrogenase accessory factor